MDAVPSSPQSTTAPVGAERPDHLTSGRYRNPIGLWTGRCFLLALLAFAVAYPAPLLVLVALAPLFLAGDALMRHQCVEVSEAGVTLHYLFSSWFIPWRDVLSIDTASGSREAPWGGAYLYLDTTQEPSTRSFNWLPASYETSWTTTADGRRIRTYRVRLPAIVQGPKMAAPDGTRTRDARAALRRDQDHAKA